jgi:2-polyprenyl-3-methyl-5-hydroxy-6-metoxy-1,4-benzoquinol methylase
MNRIIKLIKNKLKILLGMKKRKKTFDFNKTNPLGNGGERVDFVFSENLRRSQLDMYQLNHLNRYEFADLILPVGSYCADFACGTGYGSVLLSKQQRRVTGIDIDKQVISEITKRYSKIEDVNFICQSLLDISYFEVFDCIVSFETIEHFTEDNIVKLLGLFKRALKENGFILFSVPFMQEESEEAKKMGFHLTFNINESLIYDWAEKTGMSVVSFWYQNYATHEVRNHLDNKDFILCKLVKKDG